MNILIPNATGPRNTGDQVILSGLLILIREAYKNAHVVIHTSDPELYKDKSIASKINPHLYFWSVFSSRNFIVRIIRLKELLLQYISLKFGKIFPLTERKLKELLLDYKNADLIIFNGSGYLRSQKGMTQSLNLLMQLAMFYFAGLSKAPKVIAPISFGPFAYKWQEKLSARAIAKNTDVISVREELSYNALKKYGIKNLILSSDLAFLLPEVKKHARGKNKFVLGFTIRNWLAKKEQEKFENTFMKALIRFSSETGASVQPIIQADGSDYGDKDIFITKKVCGELKRAGIEVLETKRPSGVNDALSTYGNIDMLLGMRMHSNILAATQGTPFVAISYEHKTEGISIQLGMEKYVIKCEEVDSGNLFKLLEKLKKSGEVENSLRNNLKKIQNDMHNVWFGILNSYAHK